MSTMRRIMQRTTAPMWRRIRLLVSRAVVKIVDDSVKMQASQVTMQGGSPAWAERFQNYGFTSHPLSGAEGIALSVGGVREHLALVAVDDRRHRKTGLQPGEVAMYTDEGDEIVFKRGRVISVKAGSALQVEAPGVDVDCETAKVSASGSVEADTPLFTVTGKLVVQGGMEVSGGDGAQVQGGFHATKDIVAGNISLQNHVHGGVETGGATTEGPQ
ncbi:phage baseplate assembly protein V [Desulfonatronovibrio hydrogenovorans]|uniref:phage baseplate assembly protein V n=1 Tax=Desulfonatronovibrio hydrogenovorans TaxID=53245 RepID=UPI001ABF2956|nr:phage baseplate assembly protein V [Desulfonatronovibrio hydrogenovorans]